MGDNVFIEEDFARALGNIKNEIRTTQARTMQQVNANLIMMYFRIGKILFDNSLNNSHFIREISISLKVEFPDVEGLSGTNLRRMRRFYEEYKDDEKKWAQLVTKISWGHNLLLMSRIKDRELRKFYIEATIENGWSRNILDWQIDMSYHKRVGASVNNFDKVLSPDKSDLVNGFIKDPYIFDFLALKDRYVERELESKMVDGKMNFYLSAVDDLVKSETDNPTIGLILCKEKNGFTANYSLKDINKPIGVSSFGADAKIIGQVLDELPTEKELNLHLKIKEENE